MFSPKQTKNILNIPVADLVCQLTIDNSNYFALFKKAYYTCHVTSRPSFRIEIKQRTNGDFTLKKKSKRLGVLFYPTDGYTFDDISFVLKASIERFTLPQGILFLHASSFVKNGKAYVFCGQTGVGKSTIIEHVEHKQILSDDTAILRKTGNKFFVFTSPFDKRKYPVLPIQHQPLEKIFILYHGHAVKRVAMTAAEAFRQILYNNYIYQCFYLHPMKKRTKEIKLKKFLQTKNKKMSQFEITMLKKSTKSLYNLCFDLISLVDIKKLYFTKDFAF